MEIYANYNISRSGEDPKETYGEWWADNDYFFWPVSISKTDESQEKITIKGEPKAGDQLWLVYAYYSTGDSFGREYNKLEIIGVYDSQDKATQIRKAILDDYKQYKDTVNYEYDYSHTLYDADGLPVNTNTWKGYFESLTEVYVESSTLDP